MTKESRMHHAQSLLNDPMLVEVMDRQREEAIEAWLSTPATAQDTRDMCWLLIKAQEALKASLQSIVNDGKIAADRLTDKPSI